MGVAVNTENLPPLFKSHFEKRFSFPDRGIIHEHLTVTDSFARLVQSEKRGWVIQGSNHRPTLNSGLPHKVCGLFEVLGIVIRMHNHVEAKLPQSYGRRSADVPGRAGHDRDGFIFCHALAAFLFLNPVQNGVERFMAVRAKKKRTIGLSIRARKLLS